MSQDINNKITNLNQSIINFNTLLDNFIDTILSFENDYSNNIGILTNLRNNVNILINTINNKGNIKELIRQLQNTN